MQLTASEIDAFREAIWSKNTRPAWLTLEEIATSEQIDLARL